MQQAKKVPGLIEQLAAEAPARIEAVRNTDPKVVQEKVTAQAKEAQATVQSKFADVVGNLDTDLKKLGETAQDLALRGVGVAAEYAVKAREKYEEVAAHGEEAVKAWRGEVAEEIVEIAVVVEPEEKAAEDTAEASVTDPMRRRRRGREGVRPEARRSQGPRQEGARRRREGIGPGTNTGIRGVVAGTLTARRSFPLL